ncbi:Oidioi.mRNA.OKI2018_I69.XSR.g15605.t2.cds [Oikopleura dioica]|uniref:protein-tyrosine-phosphatase n=1 Tax=Oikopleura dioica TaxID=34765 RepID=A0ABN7SDE1_OIKDI|nr:Oidioi.mRNA.OKI2018_I69.XSR.g15605.t2.cds [Oikopleura dioica]
MRETLDRSRQPLEDISNKLEKDCFDEGEKEEECIVGRRQKLSECSEYEPIPDQGDTCSGFDFEHHMFSDDSNSSDFRFSQSSVGEGESFSSLKSPLVFPGPTRSSGHMDSSEKENSSETTIDEPSTSNVFPAPEEFEHARDAAHVSRPPADSLFLTPTSKSVPFQGFSPSSQDSSFLQSPGDTGITSEEELATGDEEEEEEKNECPETVEERATESSTIIDDEDVKMPSITSVEVVKRGRATFQEVQEISFRFQKEVEKTFIEPAEFYKLIRGDFSDQPFKNMLVLDCRYGYEHKAGHFKGAINSNYGGEADWKQVLLKHTFDDSKIDGQNTVIVFHCEFSQKRGPKEREWFRGHDRAVHKWPMLAFPFTRVLKGGFKGFWRDYPIEEVPAGIYVASNEGRAPMYVAELDANHRIEQRDSHRHEKIRERAERKARERRRAVRAYHTNCPVGPAGHTRSRDRISRSKTIAPGRGVSSKSTSKKLF